ncbi:MAG: hypothetical protein IJ001_09450 [Oscillospiraceae bacterium]|nr:hypothetical protein [Oscillospiraceae bacterium]
MKNKVTSILLSFVIAFGLWLYVVTNVSMEDEDTFYNIPVVMESETALLERNLMITYQSTNTISLKLSGTRSDLSKVNNQNITVKVDLSKVYDAGSQIPLTYTISYPGNVANNAFVELTRSPTYIYVSVEERRIKEVPVEVVWTGTAADGFMVDKENRTLDYGTITVEGPASVADKIQKAVIEVDVTDQKESIDQSYRYTLCDANGEGVDAELITTNVAEVRLQVKIQQVKEVELKLDVTYGGGSNEKNTTVTISPSTIRISGGEAVLKEFGDSILLGKINLAEIPDDQSMVYTITLPQGITNLSDVTEASVDIAFTGLTTKEFVVSEIESVNVPEGMEADIINEKLTVVIRGPAAELSLLTEEDIKVTVDFTGAEVGTATFKPSITLPEGIKTAGAVGTYSVSAAITQK